MPRRLRLLGNALEGLEGVTVTGRVQLGTVEGVDVDNEAREFSLGIRE